MLYGATIKNFFFFFRCVDRTVGLYLIIQDQENGTVISKH